MEQNPKCSDSKITSFLMIFNKIKGSNPLKFQWKTMKIIVNKRIEFFIIILGDNF